MKTMTEKRYKFMVDGIKSCFSKDCPVETVDSAIFDWEKKIGLEEIRAGEGK